MIQSQTRPAVNHWANSILTFPVVVFSSIAASASVSMGAIEIRSPEFLLVLAGVAAGSILNLILIRRTAKADARRVVLLTLLATIGNLFLLCTGALCLLAGKAPSLAWCGYWLLLTGLLGGFATVRYWKFLSHARTSADSVSNLGWLFFSFQGRMNRKGFWCASCVWILAAMLLDGLSEPIRHNNAPVYEWVAYILLLVFIVWTDVSTSVRRLHDLGLNGLFVIPLSALVAASNTYFKPAAFVIALSLGVFSGMTNENRYGLPYQGLFPR